MKTRRGRYHDGAMKNAAGKMKNAAGRMKNVAGKTGSTEN